MFERKFERDAHTGDLILKTKQEDKDGAKDERTTRFPKSKIKELYANQKKQKEELLERRKQIEEQRKAQDKQSNEMLKVSTEFVEEVAKLYGVEELEPEEPKSEKPEPVEKAQK